MKQRNMAKRYVEPGFGSVSWQKYIDFKKKKQTQN